MAPVLLEEEEEEDDSSGVGEEVVAAGVSVKESGFVRLILLPDMKEWGGK